MKPSNANYYIQVQQQHTKTAKIFQFKSINIATGTVCCHRAKRFFCVLAFRSSRQTQIEYLRMAPIEPTSCEILIERPQKCTEFFFVLRLAPCVQLDGLANIFASIVWFVGALCVCGRFYVVAELICQCAVMLASLMMV